ncbi:sugar ABC transporter ATP-binding protein [Cryobacterium glaciale]|uniref:Sugar ABC transporter ATP-binding protein n=1 Tax=Cryobacterium glaciale TaxID=1259145 RepID=A0A4R8V292_9MICO|nr:sugar ABC transporter ATP-binding protein [Cryobacterium glaciale]TFB75000.1 sugar ABC transporter ATP-binding protein [Cryobacterium glaciale]
MDYRTLEFDLGSVPKGSAILEARGVSKSFPGVRALDNVDLTIFAGQVTALCGENGAGKSTLINLLSGGLSPDEGQIQIGGHPLEHTPAGAIAAGVSTIHQKRQFVPAMTVEENVLLGNWPTKHGFVSGREMRKQALEALQLVAPHLPPDKLARYLSPAEAQEIDIARALARQSRILIMDEPTTALSAPEVDRLLTLVNRLKDGGLGILFVSHWLDEVLEIADHVTVFRDGRLVGTKLAAELDAPGIVSMMVGREVTDKPIPPRELGDTVLKVENLTRLGLFNDVSFEVKKGEIVTLAGVVGAGRTEVVQAIFGADKYDSGSVEVDGVKVRGGDVASAVIAGLGLVPEERHTQGLVDQLSVGDNMSLAALKWASPWGWMSHARETVVQERYFKELSIKAPSPAVRVSTLSGGNQQKVLIARWLARRPKVLILDEPTKGVDVGAKSEIHDVISGLAHAGIAILLVTSELPEVLLLSDRVLVMRQGRLVAEIAKADLTQEAVMGPATVDAAA